MRGGEINRTRAEEGRVRDWSSRALQADRGRIVGAQTASSTATVEVAVGKRKKKRSPSNSDETVLLASKGRPDRRCAARASVGFSKLDSPGRQARRLLCAARGLVLEKVAQATADDNSVHESIGASGTMCGRVVKRCCRVRSRLPSLTTLLI
eukprot:scaffold288_cov143-Ochromonas_danica.AAC.13